jgi:hypothetical protein
VATNNTTIKAKDALYAALGVADTGLEKAKDLAGGVRTIAGRSREPKTFVSATATDIRSFVSGTTNQIQKRITKRQRNATRTYNRLAKRGQTLLTRIRRQAATQRATDQVRTAQRQVKRTARTVRKAAGSAAGATVAAAQKVG